MCVTRYNFVTPAHVSTPIHPTGYPGYTCGVWGVKLKQFWGCPRGICALRCVWKSLSMRQNHAQHTFPAKNHRLHVVDTYQENRYTHLTHAPATHLRRGDVSETIKYDFSLFTQGFPKIDKIGPQMRNLKMFPILPVLQHFLKNSFLSKWSWATKGRPFLAQLHFERK